MTRTGQKPRIAIPTPTTHDSAYNSRCWPQYVSAVEACGGEVARVAIGLPPAEAATLVAGCCGILLPGSPADVNPQRYGQQAAPETAAPDAGREATDELLLQDAFHLKKPLLGICFGLQMMNVWRGGTLIQHLATGHAPARDQAALSHRIAVQPEARLLRSFFLDATTPEINSSHHQAVERPGDGLVVGARAASDGIVEALEGVVPEDHFALGVQWHPERLYATDQASLAIFTSFIAAAQYWHLPHE